MRRYEHRIRRLAQRVKDSEPARQQAQLARLSDEELMARLTRAALVLGMPEELAQGDAEAVMRWDVEGLRKAREKLLEEEPEEGSADDNDEPALEGHEQPVGDSEIIIERLGRQHGIDLDEGLSPEQRAIGLAWRRTFEEHFHQVLEWELLLHPAGATYMREFFATQAPRPVAPLLFRMIRRQFRRQLHARGIARHPPEIIAAKGRADLHALAAYLQDRSFLLANHPTTADTAVFGLLAPMVYWPMETPVAAHAKSLPAIQTYCDRVRERCFGSRT